MIRLELVCKSIHFWLLTPLYNMNLPENDWYLQLWMSFQQNDIDSSQIGSTRKYVCSYGCSSMLIQKSWKILQGVLQSPIDEHSPKQKKELGLCLFINPKLLKLFGVICKTSILFCTYLHLYLYLYLHLHLYPSVCLSICLSIFIYLFMYLYIESRINHRLLTPRQVTRPRFGACAG